MSLDKNKQFLELIDSRTPNKTKKRSYFDLLRTLSISLSEARKRGFSFKELSKLLQEIGIEVSASQLGIFFREEMNEEPRKRRRKRKRQSSKPQGKSQLGKKSNAGSSVKEKKTSIGVKKGFRVAGDDL